MGEAATRATPSENTSCSMDEDDQEALAVDLVGQEAADHGQDEGRSQLGEDDDADEGGRVREVVGVGTEDDVLHPGADVRGEGAQEDDAEGPVRQGRPCGAGTGRDGGVAVDDGVLDLLDGDGTVVALRRALGSAVGRGRHPPIVREAPTGRPWAAAHPVPTPLFPWHRCQVLG